MSYMNENLARRPFAWGGGPAMTAVPTQFAGPAAGGGPSASANQTPPATSNQRLDPTRQNFALFAKPAPRAGGFAGMSSSPTANRSPFMSFEDGGTVPEDDGDSDDNGELTFAGADQHTDSVNQALEMVNSALMYGRQKAGLNDQQSFADGGPVQDPADDSLAPGGTATDDQSAGDDFPFSDQEDQGQDQTQQAQPAQQQSIPQQLMQYVMGTDAAPPQLVQAAEQKVDPNGEMDEDMRRLATISTVGSIAGPEAAWPVIQHYRKSYDTYKAYASAALNGSDDKPADLDEAIHAANQAFPNVVDGTKVSFTRDVNDNVVATVTNVGQDKPFFKQSLTVPQFYELMRGNSGQYDNVIEKGAANAIKEAASGEGRQVTQNVPIPQARPTGANPQAPATTSPGAQMAPSGDNAPASPGGDTQAAAATPPQGAFAPPTAQPQGLPSQIYTPPNARPSQPQGERPFNNYDAEAQALGIDNPRMVEMSHKMFPYVSQEKQRLQWLAEANQHNADEENKIKAAQMKTDTQERIAEMRGGVSERNSQRHYGPGGATDRQSQAATDRANIRAKAMADNVKALATSRQGNAEMAGRWRTLNSIVQTTPGITMGQIIDNAQQLGLPVDHLMQQSNTPAMPPAAGAPQQPYQAPPVQGNKGFRIMVDPATNKTYKVPIQ